jgi:hypothetical protein
MDHSVIYLICAAFAVHRTANSLDGFVKSNVKSRILRERELSSYNESQKADLSHKKVYVALDWELFENGVIPAVFSGALLTWNCMIAFMILTACVAVISILKISVSAVAAMASKANRESMSVKGLLKAAAKESLVKEPVAGTTLVLKTIFENIMDNAYLRVGSLVHLSAAAALSTSVFILSIVLICTVFRSSALRTKAIVDGDDGKTYIHRRTLILGIRLILWVTFLSHAYAILCPIVLGA